jgi:hypothetical protein
MNTRTKRVTSLIEVLEQITNKKKFFSDETKFFCYRGQSCESWSLEPSAFRGMDIVGSFNIGIKEKALSVEHEIYNNFYNRLTRDLRFSNPWETLFYAQHYGVPTRLLDWTANPLVALYFVVSEEPTTDGAMWCLAYSKEHRQMLAQLPQNLAFLRNFQNIQSPEPFEQDISSELMIIQPPSVDTRMFNQSALFSVQFTSEPDNFIVDHAFVLNRKTDQLLKIIIPAGYKAKIKDDLEKMGINASFIYPDIQGIAQYLREKRKQQYIKQEISMDYKTRIIQSRLKQALYYKKDVKIQWHPQNQFELTLHIEGNTYPVLIENVFLENFNDVLVQFIHETETMLIQENNLKGSYWVKFNGITQEEWSSSDHKRIRAEILEYIRDTKDLLSAEEHKIYIKDEYDDDDDFTYTIRLDISKKDNNSDTILRFGPSETWRPGTPQELTGFMRETVKKHIQEAEKKVGENLSDTILVLHIENRPEYEVKDYVSLIREESPKFGAIFVVTAMDSGFVIDNIFNSD